MRRKKKVKISWEHCWLRHRLAILLLHIPSFLADREGLVYNIKIYDLDHFKSDIVSLSFFPSASFVSPPFSSLNLLFLSYQHFIRLINFFSIYFVIFCVFVRNIIYFLLISTSIILSYMPTLINITSRKSFCAGLCYTTWTKQIKRSYLNNTAHLAVTRRSGYQEIMRTTTYAKRFACNSNQYNDQWPNWRIAKIIYMTAYGGRCIAQRDML